MQQFKILPSGQTAYLYGYKFSPNKEIIYKLVDSNNHHLRNGRKHYFNADELSFIVQSPEQYLKSNQINAATGLLFTCRDYDYLVREKQKGLIINGGKSTQEVLDKAAILERITILFDLYNKDCNNQIDKTQVMAILIKEAVKNAWVRPDDKETAEVVIKCAKENGYEFQEDRIEEYLNRPPHSFRNSEYIMISVEGDKKTLCAGSQVSIFQQLLASNDK
jgi:hypothetical protein